MLQEYQISNLRLAGNVAIAVEEFKETKTNVERPKKI